jgi:hypothetical protein
MDDEQYVMSMLDELFARAKAQFGSAVQGCWLHDQDGCPGCGRTIDAVKYKGNDALSLNAFMYRPRGVLIGYLLCKRCATKIFRAAERWPNQQIPLHGKIEQSLIQAYQRYCNTMDA